MARLRQRKIILHVAASETEIKLLLAAKSFTTLTKLFFSEIEHVGKYS